ncbi:hypothetical protein J6590_056640 [Homalodisca vitripennis]|nr:hypothetical protein J6590_056640 [Homalodisca vitripennis]
MDESTFYRNAVSCNGMISYDISDSTMTGNRYEKVLNEQVLPHFTVPEMDQAIFQQDGAPPHFANPVKRLLNNNIHGRWIGLGRDLLDWPPLSPDLTRYCQCVAEDGLQFE